MSSHPLSGSASSSDRPVASGFDFEPLPSGDVVIQFFADDGKTINTQVITKEGLVRLPVVVHAFFLAVEKGKDAALAFLNTLGELESSKGGRANG